MTELFQKYKWQLATYLVLALVGFVAGYFVFSKPAKIDIQYKDREVKVVDEAKMQAEISRRVAEIEAQLKLKVTERKETKPDGTVVEEKVTEVDSTTKTKVDEVVVDVVVEERVVYQDREVVKREVVENHRNNIVSAVAMTNLPGVLRGNPAFEFGAQYQRRLIGPVFVGASVGHRGTVGVTLGFEF